MVLFLLSTAMAGDTNPQLAEELSLQQALSLSETSNEELGVARLQLQAAKMTHRSIQVQMIPPIQISANWMDYGDALEVNFLGDSEIDCEPLEAFGFGDLCSGFNEPMLIRDEQVFSGQMQAIIPISSLYSLYYGGQYASATAKLSEHDKDITEANVKIQIVQNYMTVLSLQKAITFAQGMISRLESHRSNIQLMIEQDLSNPLDLAKIETALLDAKLAKQKAESGLHLSIEGLSLLVGQRILPQPVTSNDYPLFSLEGDTPSLHPSVERSRQQLRAADAGRKIAWLDLVPMINVIFGTSVASGQGPFTPESQNFVGLSLSSTFGWGHQMYEAKASELQFQMAQKALTLQKKAVQMQVSRFQSEVHLAHAAIAVAQSKSDIAIEAQRQAKLRFEQQMLSASGLLEVESQLLEAHLFLADAQKDYLVAIARYQQALGIDVNPTVIWSDNK